MYNLPRPISLVIHILIVIRLFLFCTDVTQISCLAKRVLLCLSIPGKLDILRSSGSRIHISEQINLKTHCMCYNACSSVTA